MISLLKYLNLPWEQARGYLRADLDHLESTLNQRWGATFGDGNTLLAASLVGASSAKGDLFYVSNTLGTIDNLAIGSTAGAFLRTTGTLPQWSTLRIPNAATVGDMLVASATNVYTSLVAVVAGKILRAAGVATVPAYSTFTISDTFAAGAIPHASAIDTLTALTVGTAGQVLRSTGTLPAYSTFTIPNTFAQGDIPHASAIDTITALAKNVTATRYLSNTGASNNPAWAQVDLTNGVTGILPIGNGGTGAATAFTTGSVIFAGASGIYSQDNTNLFFDDTNNTFGFGTTRTGVISATNPSVRIVGTGATSATSSFEVQSSTTPGLFFVRNDGNVGFGTTGPGAPTHIYKDDASTNTALALLRLERTTSGLGVNGIGSRIEFYTDNDSGVSTAIAFQDAIYTVVGSDRSGFVWSTRSGAAAVERMRLDGANLMVGTENALGARFRLHSNVPPQMIVSADVGEAAIGFLSGGTSTGPTIYTTANFLGFSVGGGGTFSTTERMRIDSVGNVAIGTTTLPSVGTSGLVFGDGTALASMALNTAGLYADDIGGTVEMFGINEVGNVSQLTGLSIRKTVDESVTSAIMQADDHLTVNLAASSMYQFEIWGFWTTAGAIAGIQVQLDGTVGISSLKADIQIYDLSADTFIISRVTVLNSPLGLNDTGDNSFFIKGCIETTTAGTLFLEWAQNTVDAVNATTLQENSYFILRKLNA